MRLPVLLLAVLTSPAGVACAQVTVDLHALDSLPIGSGVLAPPAPYLPGPRPAPRHAATQAARSQPPTQAPASASVTPPATGSTSPPSALSATPPSQAAAASPPPQTPPSLPTEAPPAAPPALAAASPPGAPSSSAQPSLTAAAPPPAAQTEANPAEAKLADIRLTFASDQADLTPGDIASLKHLAASAPAGDSRVNVAAYAAGSSDDPSSARRLSLSRALAVRGALIADGIASDRIFVRALGAQAGGGPSDRADVSLLAPGSGSGSRSGSPPGSPPGSAPGSASTRAPNSTSSHTP